MSWGPRELAINLNSFTFLPEVIYIFEYRWKHYVPRIGQAKEARLIHNDLTETPAQKTD